MNVSCSGCVRPSAQVEVFAVLSPDTSWFYSITKAIMKLYMRKAGGHIKLLYKPTNTRALIMPLYTREMLASLGRLSHLSFEGKDDIGDVGGLPRIP